MPDALADYHVHTRFSVDCETDMVAACEVAINRGLAEIAFTDHLDSGPDNSRGYFQPRAYWADIHECRRRFGDQLKVLAGLEIGEPHLFPDEARTALATGPYDFVIGSAHYAVGMRPAWRAEYFEQALTAAYEGYFRQVADLAATGELDVLAHLDLVKRDARRFGRDYPGPEPYADLIRAALAAIVARGKGIEINTSPLHRGQTEACPSLTILRWYRELGGEILTVGSDAHTPDGIGSHLATAVDMARAAGFTRLARFERRQVRWVGV